MYQVNLVGSFVTKVNNSNFSTLYKEVYVLYTICSILFRLRHITYMYVSMTK